VAPLASNQLPKSVAVQTCPRDDSKFHQNYNYFRGPNRDAARYFLATADDLSPQELGAWEKVMAPVRVWKPKTWLGENDAVLHLRFFEDTRRVHSGTGTPCDHGDPKTRHPCPADSSVPLACYIAQRRTHLCSWHRDLVDDKLFFDGTCERYIIAPPFEFYKKLFEGRSAREAQRTGAPPKPGGVGGWDNVWLLSDPKGHNSPTAKRLVSELGVKVPFKHSDRGPGPLEDIWNIKSAKYIIQSYGTFSWIGAYLSRAVEVHKPYTSSNWANHWAEESALFVDDQAEWVYHNMETGDFFQTAAQVQASAQGSAFVRGIETRPKAGNMPLIPSGPEACKARAATWTACPGSGNHKGFATCELKDKVMFRRPCGSTCFDA